MRIYLLTKNIIDISVALFIIIFLFPILILITILVWIMMGNPIIFAQKRPGYKGKPFILYKFRTMKLSDSISVDIKEDYKRLNRFGKFLRNTSIDELPSLINIIKGEMSFVGPRPLLYEYKKHYNDDQNKRFLVKPGITGWAQVNGRNKLSWEEKFNLDNWYIKNQTLLLDFKIILMTVKKIFLNTDVDFDKSKDDIKFRGTNENNKS